MPNIIYKMKLKLKIESLINLIKFQLKKTKLYNRYFTNEKKYKTYGTLSDEQMIYIKVFSEVIYPPSDKKEKTQLRKIIFKWTKERTEMDGYYKEYKEFVDIIKAENKITNCKFDESSTDETFKLFNDLYQKSDLYNVPKTHNPKKLFTFIIHFMIYRKKYYQNLILNIVRNDLIDGIFNSELAYSLVGYNLIPGFKGKYSDYTEPHGLN